jgi:hypothetical protein
MSPHHRELRREDQWSRGQLVCAPYRRLTVPDEPGISATLPRCSVARGSARQSTAGRSGRSSFSGDYRLRRLLAPILSRMSARDLRGMKRSRRALLKYICRFAELLRERRGSNPATSGVTGRSWRFRAKRGWAGISGTSRPFSPARRGDLRVPAGIFGSLARDRRGMSRCLIRKLVGGRPVESSNGGLEPSIPSRAMLSTTSSHRGRIDERWLAREP